MYRKHNKLSMLNLEDNEVNEVKSTVQNSKQLMQPNEKRWQHKTDQRLDDNRNEVSIQQTY